jgi:hypothetical protein
MDGSWQCSLADSEKVIPPRQLGAIDREPVSIMQHVCRHSKAHPSCMMSPRC